MSDGPRLVELQAHRTSQELKDFIADLSAKVEDGTIASIVCGIVESDGSVYTASSWNGRAGTDRIVASASVLLHRVSHALDPEV